MKSIQWHISSWRKRGVAKMAKPNALGLVGKRQVILGSAILGIVLAAVIAIVCVFSVDRLSEPRHPPLPQDRQGKRQTWTRPRQPAGGRLPAGRQSPLLLVPPCKCQIRGITREWCKTRISSLIWIRILLSGRNSSSTQHVTARWWRKISKRYTTPK